MKDLYIDLDILNSTHSAMKNYYDELNGYLTRLNTAIEGLRDEKWETEASKQFFSTYDESWSKDIDLFKEIVGQMRDGLGHAMDEYSALDELQPFKLPNEY